MNSKEKREEIVSLINNIKEHSDRLAGRAQMPLLELSAILSKINKLHENTVVLKYMIALEQNHEDDEFIIDLGKKQDIKAEQNPNGVAKSSTEKSEVPSSFEKEKPLDDESKSEEAEAELSQQNYARSENNIAPESIDADKEELTQDLSDLIKKEEIESRADLNEQFSDEVDRSLSDQLKKQPINDLFTAIGLNERYLYANDLFGGDIDEFKKVITVLNDFESKEKAVNYFESELQPSYGWDNENDLVNALKQLVERRFL